MGLCKGCSGCEPGGVNSGIGSTQVWPKSQPSQVKPKLDLTEIQAYLIVDSLTMRFKWLIRKVSVRVMQWFYLLNFPHKCSILGWQCINIPNSKTLQNREESPISSVFSSFDPDLMSKFPSPFMVLPSMCHFWQQKKRFSLNVSFSISCTIELIIYKQRNMISIHLIWRINCKFSTWTSQRLWLRLSK